MNTIICIIFYVRFLFLFFTFLQVTRHTRYSNTTVTIFNLKSQLSNFTEGEQAERPKLLCTLTKTSGWNASGRNEKVYESKTSRIGCVQLSDVRIIIVSSRDQFARDRSRSRKSHRSTLLAKLHTTTTLIISTILLNIRRLKLPTLI